METLTRYPKNEYIELPTTERQLGFIERGKSVKAHTDEGFKLGSISNDQLTRLLQQMRKVEYAVECENYEHLEYEALIRSSTRDVWPLSLYCNDQTYFRKVFKNLTPLAQEWVQKPLKPEIVYGPRTYKRSAQLLNHVDKSKTHIISISLTLAYALEEKWPLTLSIGDEILEINMKPGEYLFYEGARIPHSRPYPLNGEFFTNMYLHWSVIEDQL